MNRFQKPDLKKRIIQSVNFSILFFLFIIGIFLYGISAVSNSSVNDGKEILENALNKDIVHCYAVEGMYPPSLSYIEKNYGLTYDHEAFIIDYEAVGSNIMPTFMIIERNQK